MNTKITKKIRVPIGERIFNISNYILITIFSIFAIYPFINVIATAFSSSRAVSSGEVFLWPIEFNVDAFKQLLQDGQIFRSMKNTVLLTVVGTGLNLCATTLGAYALSKKRLKGRKILMGVIVFMMLFNAGMIPGFILMKNLHLINTYTGLWLSGLISTYNMIVMKTFFEGIPESLEEAAAIDGASDLYIFLRITLPLSKAILATMTLFYAVGWWNSYFAPMMYLKSTAKYPLMVQLKQMLDTAQMITINSNLSGGTEGAISSITIAPETYKAASILVSTMPIICIYPFLQKYFVKGVMIGSVKG